MSANSENFTMDEQEANVTAFGGVEMAHKMNPDIPVPSSYLVNVEVEDFCVQYPQINMVVTIPLAFVIFSIMCGNVLLIVHACKNQHPNSRPVHLPTVCFASVNLLVTIVLMYLQGYVTIRSSYSCWIVQIIEQFQILVLACFGVHLLVSVVRFCLVLSKPSFQLSQSVSSPHVRTTVVVIWFQATSHSLCVLVNLFVFKHLPEVLNLVAFCLVIAVPVLTVILFVLSQAAKHYRKIRRYREWTGENFSYPPINKDCVVFKWALTTACTLLLFWLPFWTKNVYDYISEDVDPSFEAFKFYSWIVIDILLASNSLLIHLV